MHYPVKVVTSEVESPGDGVAFSKATSQSSVVVVNPSVNDGYADAGSVNTALVKMLNSSKSVQTISNFCSVECGLAE